MDMSEFLRKYSHIGNKLGEDGKHLLQKFIAGKLDVEHRKQNELIGRLKAERDELRAHVNCSRPKISPVQELEQLTSQKLNHAEETIESLKSHLREAQSLNKEQRAELRRLKYLHRQQYDLNRYLDKEYQLLMPEEFVNNTSRNGSTRFSASTPPEMLRVRLLQSQINLHVLKLDLLRTSLRHLESEESRVQELHQEAKRLDNAKPKSAEAVGRELKVFTIEMKTVREQLEQQLNDGELDLQERQKQLSLAHEEENIIHEIPVNPRADLTAKLQAVIEKMKWTEKRKIGDLAEIHNKEIFGYEQNIENIHKQHEAEVFKLKEQIRQKMHEIHEKEKLHKRLRHQINVVTRNHAKNMNVTVSVEECRKIVRGVIRDARRLKTIADSDLNEEQKDQNVQGKENAGKDGEQNLQNASGEHGYRNHAQENLDRENTEKKKKKKKRRYPGNISTKHICQLIANDGGYNKNGRVTL